MAAFSDEKLEMIKECLKMKDTVGVKKLILEEKLNDQSIYMDLASELCNHLTQENVENHTIFYEACERCLKYLIKTGNPKELLLSLLEQVDTFNDDVKWQALLTHIQEILLQLPNKRYHSLDITLTSVHAHIKSLPLPEEQELEGEEEQLIHADPNVMRITRVLTAYLDFVKPFVWEVSARNPSADRQKNNFQVKMLRTDLMQLLHHPMLFLDLRFNVKEEGDKLRSESRTCAEKLVDLLVQLCPNLMRLLTTALEERAAYDFQEKMKKVLKKEAGGDAEFEDTVSDWGKYRKDDMVSLESLGNLLYLILGEGLAMDYVPWLYTHDYVLCQALPFIQLLFKRKEVLVTGKAVKLLYNCLSRIQPGSLQVDHLDNSNFNQTLNQLINVMIMCSSKSIRVECLEIYNIFFFMFNSVARVKIYEMVFQTCRHSGVLGYTIQMIKNEIDRVLQSQCPDPMFVGENLHRLLKFTARLPEGAESDLIETSDQVIAVLNLIRYLVIRDPQEENKTGFWRHYGSLDKDFFQPLRLAIDLSKSHYNLELKGFKSGKGKQEKGVEFGVDVSVGGMPLPKVPRDQQIQIVETAINTLDMIDSLLSRISELVNSQQKGTKS